jgi:hypothetical protein
LVNQLPNLGGELQLFKSQNNRRIINHTPLYNIRTVGNFLESNAAEVADISAIANSNAFINDTNSSVDSAFSSSISLAIDSGQIVSINDYINDRVKKPIDDSSLKLKHHHPNSILGRSYCFNFNKNQLALNKSWLSND